MPVSLIHAPHAPAADGRFLRGQAAAAPLLDVLRQMWPDAPVCADLAEFCRSGAPVDLILSTSPAALSDLRESGLSPAPLQICFLGPQDIRHWISTQQTPPALPFPLLRTRLGATHVVCASHAARRQLVDEQVTVIPGPVPTHFFRPTTESRSEAYLFVCDEQTPAADLELAVVACRLTRRTLLVLGTPSEAALPLLKADHVLQAGTQSPHTLRDALRRCRALIATTPCDFDPVVVAAQACTTPVIVPRTPFLSEIVRDAEEGPGTGFFFDLPTASSLAGTLREFERRPQQIEPALALAMAGRCSVPRFQQELRRLVEHLHASRTLTVPMSTDAALSEPRVAEALDTPARRAAA